MRDIKYYWQAMLEGFTPLLRELIGSGLGACELLATIRRDNPRTSVIVTAKRIQEVKFTKSDFQVRSSKSSFQRIISFLPLLVNCDNPQMLAGPVHTFSANATVYVNRSCVFCASPAEAEMFRVAYGPRKPRRSYHRLVYPANATIAARKTQQAIDRSTKTAETINAPSTTWAKLDPPPGRVYRLTKLTTSLPLTDPDRF